MSRWGLIVAIAWILSGAAEVSAAGASLEAADHVVAGSDLEVRWTGPGAAGDFISIDAPGAPEGTYGPYAYPSAGNPLSIRVPDEPGDYVLRYHVANGYAVIAARPLVVTAPGATLDAAAAVDIGGTLEVSWTGPDHAGDFISIDPAGADDRSYGPYAYPKSGNPVSIRAPEAPGDYLIRYHMGESYRVIASRPVRVGALGATLTLGERAVAGAEVSVRWTGPGHEGDFISIDAPGAPDATHGNYAYVASSTDALTLRAPDEPGDYLVRYHLAATNAVVGTAPLRVEAATASLTAPDSVAAATVFEVRWQGPDNVGDFITLVAPTVADKEWGRSNGYTRRGNPVRLEAPREPGTYELRYLTGQSYRTLAKAPLEVAPAATASLRVVTGAAGATGGLAAVELVLDASGSMLQRLGDARRIEIAKDALVELTRALPDGTLFVLRVFGHKEAGSCRTDLELPLAPIDRAAALARIESLDAMNLAKTPIGASLLKVRDDLAGVSGAALVVLVTDGEETCGGDPKSGIEALRAAGLDVRVDIVGFAVDEVVLKDTFREWARLGGGSFFDAQDAEQLRAAVQATLRATYEVLAGEVVVASGVVNGDPVELPPGRYRVRLRGGKAQDLGELEIEPGTPRELRY